MCAISALDELTIEQLERQPNVRMEFTANEMWPSAARSIVSMRAIERVKAQIGSATEEDECDEHTE